MSTVNSRIYEIALLLSLMSVIIMYSTTILYSTTIRISATLTESFLLNLSSIDRYFSSYCSIIYCSIDRWLLTSQWLHGRERLQISRE